MIRSMDTVEPSAPSSSSRVTASRVKAGFRPSQVATKAPPFMVARKLFSHVSTRVSAAGSTHTSVMDSPSVVSAVSWSSSSGMLPVSPALSLSCRCVSADIWPSSAGMVPVSPAL